MRKATSTRKARGSRGKYLEINFDGLVGPTHNYSGLSFGNLASTRHGKAVSNPKEAALQGLSKMQAMLDLGCLQGVFPPQERPSLWHLRALGFSGPDRRVLADAAKQAPALLRAFTSASSMWVANAGTMTPSCDAADRRAHFTAANLASKLHRAIEPQQTALLLRKIFKDENRFAHHAPLPAHALLGDEGAANHTRLSLPRGPKGLHFFVYGQAAGSELGPKKFPARQTLEASQAIARLHRLPAEHTVFALQNPAAIDAGVFHNDVISVGSEDIFFFHQEAFHNTRQTVSELAQKFRHLTGGTLQLVEVPSKEVSLADAVSSYLFNTQIVRPVATGPAILIAPSECQEIASVRGFLERLTAQKNSPIGRVLYFDLRQSMRNGGGPACLRFRAQLSEPEIAAVHQSVLLDAKKIARLRTWVDKHYRDHLAAEDLVDPRLLRESQTALDELTQLLKLGSLYPFQTCARIST